MGPQQVWQTALAELGQQMDAATFASWIQNTTALEQGADSFTIAAPNTFAKEWLDTRFRAQIEAALGRVLGRTATLEVVVAGVSAPVDPPAHAPYPPPERRSAPPRPSRPPEKPRSLGGYARVPFQALVDAGLTDGEARLYGVLQGHSFGHGACHPGLQLLMAELALSHRALTRRLAALVAKRHARIVQRGRGPDGQKLPAEIELRHHIDTDTGRIVERGRDWLALFDQDEEQRLRQRRRRERARAQQPGLTMPDVAWSNAENRFDHATSDRLTMPEVACINGLTMPDVAWSNALVRTESLHDVGNVHEETDVHAGEDRYHSGDQVVEAGAGGAPVAVQPGLPTLGHAAIGPAGGAEAPMRAVRPLTEWIRAEQLERGAGDERGPPATGTG